MEILGMVDLVMVMAAGDADNLSQWPQTSGAYDRPQLLVLLLHLKGRPS
jgi:hypothetical protein